MVPSDPPYGVHSRLPCWRLRRTGDAKASEAASEEALINRYGVLGRGQDELAIRSVGGLCLRSQIHLNSISIWDQARVQPTAHTPQCGLVERLIRSVKEQCLWLHNSKALRRRAERYGLGSVSTMTVGHNKH